MQEIWEYTFSEMVNNVIDHSDAKILSVLVKRNYLKTLVFISDDGVGIFEKIKKQFNLAFLDDAICELFKGKFTTDKENHSGEGIFFSSKLMDDFAILSSDKIFAIDKFEEIVLGFSGVEWMGQGFAHQIFVLFKKQQPNIQITPVNMNEDVTKMYNYVINTKQQF